MPAVSMAIVTTYSDRNPPALRQPVVLLCSAHADATPFDQVEVGKRDVSIADCWLRSVIGCRAGQIDAPRLQPRRSACVRARPGVEAGFPAGGGPRPRRSVCGVVNPPAVLLRWSATSSVGAWCPSSHQRFVEEVRDLVGRCLVPSGHQPFRAEVRDLTEWHGVRAWPQPTTVLVLGVALPLAPVLSCRTRCHPAASVQVCRHGWGSLAFRSQETVVGPVTVCNDHD